MWRFISPNLLVFIAIILTFTATGIAFIGFFVITDNPGIFVLASALFAISGVILTSAVRLHSEARDAAFKILRSSSYDKELHVNMRVIRDLKTRLIKENVNIADFAKLIYRKDITEKHKSNLFKIYYDFTSSDVDFVKSTYVVGNFFEGLSVAIRQREINGNILYKYYVGMFIRFYEHINFYKPYLKNHPNCGIHDRHPHGDVYQPELYDGLDKLYELWAPRYRKDYCKEFDTQPSSQCPWTGRPCNRTLNRTDCPHIRTYCKPDVGP